ncbi:MAG: hypothetical protein ABFD76_10115 [Smithella sp.]
MVQFNKTSRQFTITFSGDEEDYFSMLRCISRLMATTDEQLIDKETIYYAASLLENMMPDFSQHIQIQ